MEIWLAPALLIPNGMVKRMDAMPAMVKEFPVTDFVGKSAAHAGTGDDRRALAQLLGPFDTGRCHRLAGSNDGKLREAIHETERFAGKVGFGIIAEHRSAVLETDLAHAHLGDGTNVFWYRSDSGSTTCK